MPTKPKATKNINELNSADILNVTRSELGGTYADQVPAALKEGDVVDCAVLVILLCSISHCRTLFYPIL